MSETDTARQTASLLALLSSKDLAPTVKSSRVWLGNGLRTVAKKVHEKMLKYVDMAEFKPKLGEVPEAETEKVVLLPGFEMAQAKKKPVTSIMSWIQCFARFVAAMAQASPNSTPGFMSHMLVVVPS